MTKIDKFLVVLVLTMLYPIWGVATLYIGIPLYNLYKSMGIKVEAYPVFIYKLIVFNKNYLQ